MHTPSLSPSIFLLLFSQRSYPVWNVLPGADAAASSSSCRQQGPLHSGQQSQNSALWRPGPQDGMLLSGVFPELA